jgi:CIC family chloride channel protein
MLLAALLGAVAGLVGAAFRLALDHADTLRNLLIETTWGAGFGGLVLIMGIAAAATALAAWLVHRLEPRAKGSGIPSVEAVLHGQAAPPPLRLIVVKFFGGILSIGAGMALGREGPSVQMGASLSQLLSRLCRHRADQMALLAAGAGAGLATAFNAPVAGAVFVLEELVRRFHTRTTLSTLCASAAAIALARLFLGEAPDFRVEPLSYPGFGTVPIYLTLGALLGVLGAFYNRAILGMLALQKCLRGPVEMHAALVGAAVGALGWWWPHLIGGGDHLTQRILAGQEALLVLALWTLIRFGLGAVCYSAGTPGGLFAPMLVVGAGGGFLIGAFCGACVPGLSLDPKACAVVGMAAFFTASVRAPVTGIVLVTEMTGSFTLLLPLLLASFPAMLVPTLLRDPPIYDSLREPVTPPTGHKPDNGTERGVPTRS